MVMPREEFINVCIEIGYDAAKEAYMKKVREAEEREAMKQFLEMRRLIKGINWDELKRQTKLILTDLEVSENI